MTTRSCARFSWSLFLLATLVLGSAIAPPPALALSHYWGRHPDKERLVVVFPETIPAYSVKRTGKKEISVVLPAGYWERDAKPQPGMFGKAELLQNVVVTPEGLRILLKTDAFGYIQFPLRDRGKLVVDVFKDPIGAKWEPGKAAAPSAPPASSPVTPAPEAPEASSESATAPQEPRFEPIPPQEPQSGASEGAPSAPQAETMPEPEQSAPAQEPGSQEGQARQEGQESAEQTLESLKQEFEAMRAQESAKPAPVEPEPSAPSGEQVRSVPGQGQKNFFSVPYNYRAPIKKENIEEYQAPDKANPSRVQGETSSLAPRDREANGRVPHFSVTSRQDLLDGMLFSPSVAHAAEESYSVRRSIGAGQPPPQEDTSPTPIPPSDETTAQSAQPTDADTTASSATPEPSAESVTPPVREVAPSARQAPQEEDGGFALRAKMAPPTQTIPVAVGEPARLAPPGEWETKPAPRHGVEASQPTAAEPAAAIEPAGDAESAGDAEKDATREQGAVAGETPPALPQERAAPSSEDTAATSQPETGGDTETVAEPGAAQEAAKQADTAPTGEEEAKDAPTVTELQMAKKAGKDPNAPPNFGEVFLTARAAMANGDYQNAVDLLDGMKRHPLLPDKMRGDVLFNYADALYALSKDNLRENYTKLVDAYTEAMNDDLASPRVPEALFNLGLINLKVNSPRQAEAYFNILKDRYPDDDRIPMINYYWGDYYFNHEDYQKAANEFQYIVQKYPDNRFVREASVGLARSLNKLGYQDQAQEIVEYIEKRWPRYYVEYPPLLRLYGDVNYKVGMLDRAKLNYWTYYNMDPDGEGADVILARLGDIYLELGDVATAKEVYEKAVRKYPEREGGLISQMRLAEQGVYDTPSLDDMFSVFDRPYTEKPADVYEMIVKRYPNSELAPLAQLKLAMWYLWNDKFREALNATNMFRDKFPGNTLMESAREVALKAFDKYVAQAVREENYTAIVDLWENSPILLQQQEDLAPETRIGLSTAFWKTGHPQQARNMLDPFFLGAAMPKHSENALMLAMAICLDNRDWRCITDLQERTELWELSPRVREELEYNLALAYENLEQPEKSAPLWANLADREDIDLAQQAYINYFLAHESWRKSDYKKAYEQAQDSLSIFLEKPTDEQKIKDLLALLMGITDKTGRIREALKWAIEYSRYVNKNDPEWPALRYQMAQFYRKLADNVKWRAILEELVQDNPTSLYGRMAASDLQTSEIEKNASQFTSAMSRM